MATRPATGKEVCMILCVVCCVCVCVPVLHIHTHYVFAACVFQLIPLSWRQTLPEEQQEGVGRAQGPQQPEGGPHHTPSP